MKKICITLGVVALFLFAGALVKQNGLFAETSETPASGSLSQEADRNRELLEIWKEHVKTLTKERDDAYRQMERMKAGTPAGQFGVETMPIPSAEMTQQITGLESEVSRLQGELQRKTAGDPNRELQMQFSALQNQLQQAKKELSEARSEKDRLIQEKEKALAQVERLEADSQFSSASGDPDREQEAYVRQARELQYENESLKANIEKLEVVQKELASTRGYFTPLVKSLQEKNGVLSNENGNLRAEVARLKDETSQSTREIQSARSLSQQFQKESERSAAELDELKIQSQRLEADIRSLQAEREQTLSQVESYKSQLQLAAADRDKWRSIEQDYNALADRHAALQKAYDGLEQDSRSSEGQLRQMSSQVASLEQNNRDLAAREANARDGAEKYRTALAANLGDMKNLKGNFEAYLESLVASFEERQK